MAQKFQNLLLFFSKPVVDKGSIHICDKQGLPGSLQKILKIGRFTDIPVSYGKTALCLVPVTKGQFQMPLPHR